MGRALLLMDRIMSRLFSLHLAFGLVALGAVASCKTLETKVYSNVDSAPSKPKEASAKGPKAAKSPAKEEKTAAPAILQQRGFRFWLVSEEKRDESGKPVKEKFDILRLRPDGYLIGFIQLQPQAGGAAFCRLEPGRTYSFEVTGQEYMPKSGTYVLKGRCFFDPDRSENKGIKVESSEPKTGSK